MSWQDERAQEIWEGILNGDTPQYTHTEFSDIENLIDIDGGEDDYEIETHMNHLFLKNGYEWIALSGDGDLGLHKSAGRFYKCEYSDLQWFTLMKIHGENLPEEYCDIFDRDGEVCEDYDDIFNVNVYVVD